MKIFKKIFLILLLVNTSLCFAGRCGDCTKDVDCPPTCDVCCGGMGGVSYCDSSAGRLVCNNGYYSSCYCNRHAIMDLNDIQGCCLWQGGVLNAEDGSGSVLCNNGAVSEICSAEISTRHSASW